MVQPRLSREDVAKLQRVSASYEKIEKILERLLPQVDPFLRQILAASMAAGGLEVTVDADPPSKAEPS